MDRNEVAIVILSWNGKHFLEKFLKTTIAKSKNHARIIVADNGSTDGSTEYLKTQFPEIEYLQFETNLGFTGGYNAALKMIKAKYYVLLNSDIEVSDNWLVPALKMMEKDKTIGACQPKILQYNNREIFEYAGAAGGFIDFLGYPFCRGRLFNILEKDNSQYDSLDNEIFWASGACMFIRAECFHKFGRFDEHFFAHMEEIDLCWRLKHNGKKIVYCHDSVVYHVGGGTLPKTNPRKTYLNFRNNLWVLAKNVPGYRFYIILFVRFILDNLAAFKFLSDGNIKDSIAVLKAHLSFLGKVRKMRKSIKNISNNKVSKIYLRSIAFDFFVNRRKYFSELPDKKFR